MQTRVVIARQLDDKDIILIAVGVWSAYGGLARMQITAVSFYVCKLRANPKNDFTCTTYRHCI